MIVFQLVPPSTEYLIVLFSYSGMILCHEYVISIRSTARCLFLYEKCNAFSVTLFVSMDYILFDKIIQLTIVDDPKFIDGMHYL